MKRCPICNRVESDDALVYCRTDGTPLITDSLSLSREAGSGSFNSKNSEIETSILPHRTDAHIGRSTGPTTLLPTAPIGTQELTRTRRTLITVIIVGVLCALGVSAYVYLTRNINASVGSVAVLPFINESGNAEVEYLSDGMTETLINSLSGIPNLSVKARASVFRYKGKEFDPRKVASDLDVQTILIGRVVQRGEQLTLNLELIEAQTENVLWGHKYERKSTDLVALQSEVARDVSNKLKAKLSNAEEAKVARSYTANAEAYHLYLKGLFYWNKRTPEALKKSVEYFSQAIEKDPNYALAYAGIASTYVLFPEYSVSLPKDAVPKAKAMARKALKLDDTLAEAHTALGYALLTYDRNYAESNREFNRAIELNPNYATAYQWYADGYLLSTQRFDEALTSLRKAQELDPLSLVINAQIGLCYIYMRDYDKAIEHYRRTIELDPKWYLAHWFLGLAYELKGRFNDAVVEYQRARELNDDPYVLAYLAHVYAAMGKRDEAVRQIAEMKEMAKYRYVPAYAFAIAYEGLGDKQEALNWLERSDEDRAWDIIHIKVEPFFDSLRNEPRFIKLVERVGL